MMRHHTLIACARAACVRHIGCSLT